MIEVTEIEVMNWKAAIRGMRNPMESWDQSDSEFGIQYYDEDGNETEYYDVQIGENDLDLMNRLYKASLPGDDHAHRKFMRQIFVSMNITAPDYFFKEFSTYKVGVTENSTSTMHRIHSKEFTLDDFSHEHLRYEYNDGDGSYDLATWAEASLLNVIDSLNRARDLYLKSKDKKHWWLMIQLLPMSYNYTRTVTMNYENAITMIKQRTNHKLDEWNEFVDILWELPYLKEICKED